MAEVSENILILGEGKCTSVGKFFIIIMRTFRCAENRRR